MTTKSIPILHTNIDMYMYTVGPPLSEHPGTKSTVAKVCSDDKWISHKAYYLAS